MGKVFIINNENFLESSDLFKRPGSDIDADNLKSLFTQLQFEVVIAKDRTAQVGGGGAPGARPPLNLKKK
jgi:hypothetical protein